MPSTVRLILILILILIRFFCLLLQHFFDLRKSSVSSQSQLRTHQVSYPYFSFQKLLLVPQLSKMHPTTSHHWFRIEHRFSCCEMRIVLLDMRFLVTDQVIGNVSSLLDFIQAEAGGSWARFGKSSMTKCLVGEAMELSEPWVMLCLLLFTSSWTDHHNCADTFEFASNFLNLRLHVFHLLFLG